MRNHSLPVVAMLCFAVQLPLEAAAQPSGPEQHSETSKTDAPSADETVAEVSAGGLLNTGNTESWQANVGGTTRVVRGSHAFAADLQFAYGQADLPDDMSDEYQDTVRQLNASARYDFFFTENDAIFIGESYRWDTFAGIDTRLQTQVGYLRNLFSKEKHRLWFEAGYDFTYDNYHLLPSTPRPFLEEDFIHSARAFVGYDNRLNPHVTFKTGFETLINFERGKDTRINWNTALRSTVAGQLQVELKFSLKFDNVPPQGAEKLDTLTQVNLIYTFEQEEKAEEEEG